MRPSLDEWALSLALVTAKRATCKRRQVGCVLLSSRGHVLATGYNGVATGLPHCTDYDNDPVYLCTGLYAVSGSNLDGCHAIHAEQNALLQCRDIHNIRSAYVTCSPCITCCKLLLNTSCERIVFNEEYAHPTARKLWEASGRRWEQFVV